MIVSLLHKTNLLFHILACRMRKVNWVGVKNLLRNLTFTVWTSYNLLQYTDPHEFSKDIWRKLNVRWVVNILMSKLLVTLWSVILEVRIVGRKPTYRVYHYYYLLLYSTVVNILYTIYSMNEI